MKSGLNKPILFYETEFYIFSNFSSFTVEWKGVSWMTAEHAYQAAKFEDKSIQEKIRKANSAHDAKKIAETHKSERREDWGDIKLSIMEEIVRTKLSQHSYIQKRLKQTGDREIIENSPKNSFWGWGSNKDGQNNLGKIWMKLRNELKSD